MLRGKLIMWSSRKKKEKQILEEINATKQKLNKILDNQVEIKLKYIKQSHYENGPRAKKTPVNNYLKDQSLKSGIPIPT